MGFFDDLQGKLTKGSQAVANKTKEVADITKLKVQISSEERKIQDLYIKIGKAFYEANPSSEMYAEEIAAITESMKTIARCKEEVAKKKGVLVCDKCGAENPVGSVFCSVCGEKYEVKETEETAKDAEIVKETEDVFEDETEQE
ncbi:MAG: zinc-ribbon domain-containing protein [Lachnospiraceae bacterium]